MGTVNPGITALELAASKSSGRGPMLVPSEVACRLCGQYKRLHGVWRFGVWYCPFCVTYAEIRQ